MILANESGSGARNLLHSAIQAPQIAHLASEIADLELLADHYYENTSVADLIGRDPEDLVGAVVSHLRFAQTRPAGVSLVRIFTPTVPTDGWTCDHTVVEIVTDDMPFIVDSVSAALNQAGRTLSLVIHPVFAAERNEETGELMAVAPESTDYSEAESWVHVEIDRESDPETLLELETLLRKVLGDVRSSVEDWGVMRGKAVLLASELESSPPPAIDSSEINEASEFLRWLAHNHFTFLGYREYDLVNDPVEGELLLSKPNSGFGVLRSPTAEKTSLALLPAEVRAKAHEPRVLVLTKANRRSSVHRPAYLDYVGVKKFDADGNVIGERRFIGLMASSVYADSAMSIPVVRRTIGHAIAMSGYNPGSHSARDLLQFCETYPRDELFQMSSEQLLSIAREVLAIAERRQTRLFLRNDEYGRFVSALVYLPRDRFTTDVRLKMMAALERAYGAISVDHVAFVSESVLARLHFVARMPAGVPIPDIDVDALTAEIMAAPLVWEDEFAEALKHQVGEERANELVRAYTGIPEAYKETVAPRAAVADVMRLDKLSNPGDCAVYLHDALGHSPDEHRFTLYCVGEPVALYEILPVFTSLGAGVLEERPYGLKRSDGIPAWIFDVGLRIPRRPGSPDSIHGEAAAHFCKAFIAAWKGRTETDRLNELVPAAGLSWREVSWLRAWVQYSRQLGTPFSYQYIERVINANAPIASLLVQLFRARLDPDLSDADREATVAGIQHSLEVSIDAVVSLDADRILRQLWGIVNAVLRTSAFQIGPDGKAPVTVTIKVDPSLIPNVPSPLPMYEIWVSSPNVSGVHLRFGPVARGGLRWSDRPEDMRTEILGLVKAQMVKNAVIVPVGAKGGFYVKRPRDASDRTLWTEDGIACYKEFINSLLSVTDNLIAGEVIPPERTVRHDGDDTYLVVAADKGTAAFSDIANAISVERGFWLADAFASGGSNGYDHKAMGITARGAWEAVKRHFRELGIDTQSQPFTVVGIGDMSGDVFGNGMLLSEHIRLVAAFDHRHIFIDPDPNAAIGFAERQRLAALPRSSWEDYDKALISEGGGVFSRALKHIPISPQMQDALGLPDSVTSLTPDELVRAILLAPVDLLWNGGIGTYVKALHETDAEVGDKASDAVRVNGCELRCRVVGEGGNLGLTQPGRIEAARNGVQLNTDSIDNSAGVDCSDHEVNIKIALGAVVNDGDLTMKQRNELLEAMTDDVAAHVLLTNYRQNQLLGTARVQPAEMLPVHRRLITWLVNRGEITRKIEYLPSDAELADREANGLGLTSPELAVLLSWVKIAITKDLTESPLADEPWFDSVLRNYFPSRLVEAFPGALEAHPLRRQIISTVVANEIVDSGGISFAYRAMEETGASTVEVVRAFIVAREVFGLPALWYRIALLDGQVSTQAQGAMILELRRLLDRATRWVLSLRGGTVDVEGEITRFGSTVMEASAVLNRLLVGGQRTRWMSKSEGLMALGAPEDLAQEIASSLDRFSLLDIDDIARRYDESPTNAAEVYFAISEHYGIDFLLDAVTRLPRNDRWSNLARASIRSDLYAVLAGLTSRVLRTTTPDDVPESRIADWELRNAEGQQRARQTLSDIDMSGQYDLATLSVALRTLRTLVQQGTGGGHTPAAEGSEES